MSLSRHLSIIADNVLCNKGIVESVAVVNGRLGIYAKMLIPH